MTLGEQATLPEDALELTPARRRRNRERAAARETILSAALDVAHRDGWDAVTMRRLADEIEYSANFAYRYFTGRDDILHTLVREGFSRLCDAMTAAAQQTGPASGHHLAESMPNSDTSCTAAWRVRRAGHAYLDFALADPDLYQLMYGLGGVRVPAIDAWVEGQAVGDIMAELLTAAGDLRAEQHVLQLWATAHGLIALLVVGRVNVDACGLHTLFEEALTDCLIRALPGQQSPGITPP
ncbi:TetR/AcrR family transcriptional regulator [Mycobacteroides abscessus]|uniref:TetR/AcrR family transcriptional regulator n=1 Tax=Mycobacteroides abscessus TaxID=36809 RepID=UPI000C26121F|nr:TetR/AcrR family transcriptional regulator [Mycobacteroides abscessus]